MKPYILLAVLALLQITCDKKGIEGDLAGKEYIRGRLFLYDNITQQADGTPLAKKTVNLSYEDSPDQLNYLFSTQTDSDGYFVFKNLNKTKRYRATYEETVAGVVYAADTTSSATMDTLRLNARVAVTKQKGINIRVTDAAGKQLKGVDICIFSSQNVGGYLNNTCDGSVYKTTTDASGQANQLPIPAGTYYVLASIKTIDNTLTAKQAVTVTDKIEFLTLIPKLQNGIEYTVYDPVGKLLPAASLCFFTGQALYNRDTCDGSNFQLGTDIYGKATRYNLLPQEYYVYASYKIGNEIWFAKDTIQVTNIVLQDTLRFTKKIFPAPNGILYTVFDSLGTLLPNASLCFFTSQVLYNRDTCDGSNFQQTSDPKGEAAKYSIPPEKYFVYATYTAGKDIWVARDTINVGTILLTRMLTLRKKY